MFETPILFLIFNRPELTEKVFERIREIKPKYLFIAADGPRAIHPEDIEKCMKAREIVLEAIDWDCEVKTLFREKNLGCGLAVSQAITWFFEHVEMGIILEDDCLPDLSFFRFCEELLKYYKDDSRIMMISGTNLLNSVNNKFSYFYSKIGTIWGWGSWRRSWKLYDFYFDNFDTLINTGEIYNVAIDPHELKERIKNLKKVKSGQLDTWDYQWTMSRIINSGLSIIPTSNLISNIGCNSSGTHTNTKNNPFANLVIKRCVFPLNHPLTFSSNKLYDQQISKIIYPIKLEVNYFIKILNKINKVYRSFKIDTNKYKNSDNLSLHLGCGSRLVSGWINIDLKNSDLNIDLSKGKLPFINESVNYVVSQHFFEHLYIDSQLIPLLNEIFRVLKPQGELWFSVPSIKKISIGYLQDKGESLLRGRSSRFPNYNLNGKPCSHIVNDIFYQNGEHKNLFDYDLINWVLTISGFVDIGEVNEKTFLNKFDRFPERNDDDVSIYCKAIKPQ